MMTLYCFSGTGNALRLANVMKEELQDVQIRPFTPITTHPPSDKVGFLFPSFYGDAPRMVQAFLATFPAKADVYYCAIVNCTSMAGNALWRVHQQLGEKGAELAYGQVIHTVGSNLLRGDLKAGTIAARCADADNKARRVAQDVRTLTRTRPTRRSAFVAYMGRKMPTPDSDRAFICNRQACTNCGQCAKLCPARNIQMSDAAKPTPVWGGQCEICLACMQWCPANAIDYGVRTVGRTRYHHPEVSLEDVLALQGEGDTK